MHAAQIYRAQIYRALTTLFHDLFADDSIVLRPQTTADDIAGWDSFTHLNLIVAVEARFGIKMRTVDIDNMTSVRDLVDVIEAAVAATPQELPSF